MTPICAATIASAKLAFARSMTMSSEPKDPVLLDWPINDEENDNG